MGGTVVMYQGRFTEEEVSEQFPFLVLTSLYQLSFYHLWFLQNKTS